MQGPMSFTMCSNSFKLYDRFWQQDETFFFFDAVGSKVFQYTAQFSKGGGTKVLFWKWVFYIYQLQLDLEYLFWT